MWFLGKPKFRTAPPTPPDLSVQLQDYYASLGVPRTATAEEIKLGFRKLARIHHPDAAKDKTVGEAKFKEINEAYEVLGDPVKRRRYDELGAHWQDDAGARDGNYFDPRRSAPGPNTRRHQRPSAGSGYEYEGTGFSDFFSSVFGHAPPGAQAGAEVEADLLVTLEEALRGATRKIMLRRPASFDATERSDTYKVRIPPGVREGQRIRLAGQGNAGHEGAAAGDLFLRVRLARHPHFVVEGADLAYELDLAPWEAVLGVEVQLPALDGATTLRVPAGAAAGMRLRLRGLGLPREGGERGDLFATVRLLTPTPVSHEERELWEQLAKVSPYKARPGA